MNITVNRKGLLFSLDLLLAVLVMLFMATFFLVYSQNLMAQEKANVRQLMLEKKAVARLDRLLKKDAAALAPGIAHYNSQKKRVEENVIELSRLSQFAAQGFFADHPFVPPGQDCLVLERLAWDRDSNRPALVGVIACE